MRYVLLITGDEHSQDALSPAEAEANFAEFMKFGAEMSERGVLKDGNRLRPTSDATTVRVRDGKVVTSDGPFAETKEQIGGYYVIECDNLDEAIEIASKNPGARLGSVEVRPLWEM